MRLFNPRHELKCELMAIHADLDWSHRNRENKMNKNTNCNNLFPAPNATHCKCCARLFHSFTAQNANYWTACAGGEGGLQHGAHVAAHTS
jgi:hypothetical protein